MNVLLVLVLAVFTSPVSVQAADTAEATVIVTVSGSAGILA